MPHYVLVFGTGLAGERSSFFENTLIQVRLKGKALNPLGVRRCAVPAGFEHYVDGVNDPVLADDVRGKGRPTGVGVELSDKGFIDISFSELLLTFDLVATKGFEGSLQLVGVKIPGDDVGFNTFFVNNTIITLDSGIRWSKDGKGSFPPKDLGTGGLVDGGLEAIKVVVFFNVQFSLVFQRREVTVTNAGAFQGSKGLQNGLVGNLTK